MEAALARAAERYNRGACDLEAFVMRMVAVSGREAVVESLHAVGYGCQVQLRPDPGLPACPLGVRQLASVLQLWLPLSCARGRSANRCSLPGRVAVGLCRVMTSAGSRTPRRPCSRHHRQQRCRPRRRQSSSDQLSARRSMRAHRWQPPVRRARQQRASRRPKRAPTAGPWTRRCGARTPRRALSCATRAASTTRTTGSTDRCSSSTTHRCD